MLGIDLLQPALKLPELDEKLPLLRRQENVLMDRTSRADFGPRDGKRFGADDVGVVTDVTGKQIKIAGTFEMGTGLAANGALLINRDGFRRIAPEDHTDRVSMILVDLNDGVTIDDGIAAIRRRLSQVGGPAASIQVITADEAVWAERRRWYAETPIGTIFAMGVLLARHRRRCDLLHGFGGRCFSPFARVCNIESDGLFEPLFMSRAPTQACSLAGVALPPATLAALGLYVVTSHLAGVPIHMTWFRVVLVAILSIVMCSSAGVLALRKLGQVEPASLF